MSAYIFECPGCGAKLRMSGELPAGSFVMCPKCSATITVPQTPPTSAALTARPPPPLPLAHSHQPADDDDINPDAPFAPRRLRNFERRPIVTILATAAVLAVVVGGLGYVILNHAGDAGHNQGTGDEDPLAYLSGQSSLIVHLDFEAVFAQPVLGARVEQQLLASAGNNFYAECKRQTGLEFKDLFAHVYYGFHGNFPQDMERRPPPVTMVIRSRLPFEQRRVARSTRVRSTEKLQGKTYYRVDDPNFAFLFMPSDRIMVLSNVTPAEMEKIVASDGSQALLKPEVMTFIRGIEAHSVWMVVLPLEGMIKVAIQDAVVMAAPEGLRGLGDALVKSRVAALWGGLEGEGAAINIAIDCADADSAARAVKDVQSYWDANLKGLGGLKVRAGLMFLPKPLQALFAEFLTNTNLRQDGKLALASTKFKLQTLIDFAVEAEKMGRQAGPPMPPPGPGQPPPLPPPR